MKYNIVTINSVNLLYNIKLLDTILSDYIILK